MALACALDVGLVVEARLRLLDHPSSSGGSGATNAAAATAEQERVLGELRQLVVCVEKQLSQLAQGDKWRDVCQLFHDFLLLAAPPTSPPA
jgi:hypothetical protein